MQQGLTGKKKALLAPVKQCYFEDDLLSERYRLTSIGSAPIARRGYIILLFRHAGLIQLVALVCRGLIISLLPVHIDIVCRIDALQA